MLVEIVKSTKDNDSSIVKSIKNIEKVLSDKFISKYVSKLSADSTGNEVISTMDSLLKGIQKELPFVRSFTYSLKSDSMTLEVDEDLIKWKSYLPKDFNIQYIDFDGFKLVFYNKKLTIFNKLNDTVLKYVPNPGRIYDFEVSTKAYKSDTYFKLRTYYNKNDTSYIYVKSAQINGQRKNPKGRDYFQNTSTIAAAVDYFIVH